MWKFKTEANQFREEFKCRVINEMSIKDEVKELENLNRSLIRKMEEEILAKILCIMRINK